ncbi:hypothetical protein [Nocardia sp. NPDC058480]
MSPATTIVAKAAAQEARLLRARGRSERPTRERVLGIDLEAQGAARV